MTPNRTSQAATRWAVVSQLDVPIRCSLKGADELLAIMEKYKRMEGALKEASDCCHDHCTDSTHQRAAEEALDFDPLAQ